MDSVNYNKLFKLVRAKLSFWLLSSKSQFDPTEENGYTSLDRIMSTSSLRSFDKTILKDIIHLIVKLEPNNFELDESGDFIKVSSNNPKMICKSLGI
jgi:hypothetical protein